MLSPLEPNALSSLKSKLKLHTIAITITLAVVITASTMQPPQDLPIITPPQWTERKNYNASLYSLTTLAGTSTAATSRMDVTCREESTVGIPPSPAPTQPRAAASSPSSNERVDSDSLMDYLYPLLACLCAAAVVVGIIVVMFVVVYVVVKRTSPT